MTNFTRDDIERPDRFVEEPLPPAPEVDRSDPDQASLDYSTHRTKLSRHRTHLSEHRTDLSEYRTDLSTRRTDMSISRTDMSTRRTGMSFQRTRMSADRTLMSVIRTSLSLIGFGFTIYQAFEKLREAGVIQRAGEPRNFGIALVCLGVLMLIVGIVYHLNFMLQLRRTRTAMTKDGMIHGDSDFPVSFTLLTAVALLLIGLVAAASMVFTSG